MTNIFCQIINLNTYYRYICFVSYFSGCMCGKVFSLYLMLLLFEIIVTLFVCLSGMNNKRVKLWSTIIVGLLVLMHSATLYHFCNYAHYFANIVRYQRTLFESTHTHTHIHTHIYIYIYTGFPRRNVPNFGRVFLGLKYTDITQNTYIQI